MCECNKQQTNGFFFKLCLCWSPHCLSKLKSRSVSVQGFWEKNVCLQGFCSSLSPVCFCCFGFKRQREIDRNGQKEREIQALKEIQTTNLFLVVEPLLVAVSA